jgi:hypothetical protein
MDLAAEADAAACVLGEIVDGDADAREVFIQRQHQLAAHVIAEGRLVHHRHRGDVLGDQARGQLVVIRAPFADLRAHDDALAIRGVELVDQGRDDAALADALAHVVDVAELRFAAAEEAHQRDLGARRVVGRRAAGGKQGRGNEQ